MAIDKSTRQHYAIQGGGPNYLGKQKMVTAPKKWLSSPDHEPAELAYITKKEKDILLDLNIYGSLKNGKPNRGPSGIMSLQGDMGGYGGTGGGGGSGGGGGGQDRHPISNAGGFSSVSCRIICARSAAPCATASSADKLRLGSLPERVASIVSTIGIRVDPPTVKTTSISFQVSPDAWRVCRVVNSVCQG